MREIVNPNRYISPEIIEECFRLGKSTNVDKQITGNGFSHGFGLLRPANGKVNVMIAPNQSVVKDKELEYKENKFGFKNARIAFVYSGSQFINDYLNYDIIVIVGDSFYHTKNNFTPNRIDKILFDEIHTTHIQSGLRPILPLLLQVLNEKFIPYCSVVYLTATPNKHWEIDVEISNTLLTRKDVLIGNNIQTTIESIVRLLIAGEKVYLFTNESDIICDIINRAKLSTISLDVGNSLLYSLIKKVSFILDNKALLSIHSSKSFEGWSSREEDVNVFIISNIGRSHSFIFQSQMVQALGRTRNGFKTAEICIRNQPSPFRTKSFAIEFFDLDELIETYLTAKSSPEKKLSKSYSFRHKGHQVLAKQLRPFIVVKTNSHKITLIKNNEYIKVFNEKKAYKISESYFNKHGYRLRRNNDKEVNLTKTYKMSTTTIIENVKANNFHEIIQEIIFSNQPNTKLKTKDFLLQVLKCTEDYFKVLSYFSLGPPIEWKRLYKLLITTNLEKEIYSIFIKRKKAKGLTGKKLKASVSEFKKYGLKNFVLMALNILRKRSVINEVAFRNYNEYTQVSISIIEFLVSKLGLIMVEIDIVSAFPRIIYALNGLSLPKNFYGLYKKNKVEINTYLNCFRFNKSKKSNKKTQKQNAKRKFERLGFHPRIINWLLENWFETEYKGDLFNFLAYHEKIIITESMSQLESYNKHDKEKFIVRRHDSLLYFTNSKISPFTEQLNYYKYHGINGFFPFQFGNFTT